MKTYFFLLVCLVCSICFGQENQVVKTEDGQHVLLKADFTWEYIDAENASAISVLKSNNDSVCNLDADFVEPKLNQKIQVQLKKGRATIGHVKKKVAKDLDCEVADVFLISVSEQRSKAIYRFCANGKQVDYKRIGNTIIKKEQLF